jgi:Holliday junction DNA helicase RuvA
MLSSLRGVVQRVGEESVVLEVGGVGFRVHVTTSVLDSIPGIGKPFFLHARLIVREDSISLYGFHDPEQRELFDLLLQVSGVGPRLALAALSHLATETLRSAVGGDQPEVLTRVPGIGMKTAEKIIFQLRDRLAAPVQAERVEHEADEEVLGVLTTLGYNLVEAQAAIQSLPEDAPEEVEERVRLALRYFS